MRLSPRQPHVSASYQHSSALRTSPSRCKPCHVCAGLNQGVLTASLRQAVTVASTTSARSPFSSATAAIALATLCGPGVVTCPAYPVCADTFPPIAADADSLSAVALEISRRPYDGPAGIAHAAIPCPPIAVSSGHPPIAHAAVPEPTGAQPAIAAPRTHAPTAHAAVPQPNGAQPAVTVRISHAPIAHAALAIPAISSPAHAVCRCPNPVTRHATRPPHWQQCTTSSDIPADPLPTFTQPTDGPPTHALCSAGPLAKHPLATTTGPHTSVHNPHASVCNVQPLSAALANGDASVTLKRGARLPNSCHRLAPGHAPGFRPDKQAAPSARLFRWATGIPTRLWLRPDPHTRTRLLTCRANARANAYDATDRSSATPTLSGCARTHTCLLAPVAGHPSADTWLLAHHSRAR